MKNIYVPGIANTRPSHSIISLFWRHLILSAFLLAVGVSDSWSQTVKNKQLYLQSPSQILNRTDPVNTGDLTKDSTTVLFKTVASVTSSGSFRTSNSGYTLGTMSSNANNFSTTAATYTPSGASRLIFIDIASVPGANNAVSSVQFRSEEH